MKKRVLWALCAVLWISLSLWAMCACSGECLHLQMSTRTFAPNCSEQGYILNTCQSCGYTFKSDIVAPYGHDLIAQVSAPSCSEPGYTEYACSCGYRYTSDIVAPLGHDMTSAVYAPSCSEPGYTEYTCSCGYHYTSGIVAPLGHDMTSVAYAPSCDGQGRTDYRCTRCALSYSADFVPPAGHTFSVQTTSPVSCAVTGHSTYECTTCGYSYTGDYLFYSDVFDGAYTAATLPLASGVDVSKYNHQRDEATGEYLPLDFEDIRDAGYDFVILKAGSTVRVGADGTVLGGLEPTFEADYAAARAAGLDIGVYFYTYALTVEQTQADARMLMSWLDGKQLEYPVYLDMEETSLASLGRRQTTELCVAFISALQESRYFGALYVNNNWLTNYLQSDKVTFLFDVWYARYPSGEGPYEWDTEKYGQHMGLWQYSQSGLIPTVCETMPFDLNYAYKDYPLIMRALGYNGYGEK